MPAVYDQYGRTNNFRTGKLPYRPMIAKPVQGSKTFRGDYASEFQQMGDWPIDQTVVKNGQVKQPSYNAFTDPEAGFSRAYVAQMGAPGANQGTGPKMAEEAQKAIVEVLVSGGTPAAVAPPVDPWRGARIQQAVAPQQGLVTGDRPGASGLFGPVRIASGKSVPVGSMGPGGGQVQSDGSVKNIKSGKVTAPPPGQLKDGSRRFEDSKVFLGGSWW